MTSETDFPIRRAALAACLSAVALLSLTAMMVLAASATARTHAYHSPGYRGTDRVPRGLRPRPQPPVTIGKGENPSILLDGAGTAHIVWNQPVDGGADQLHYCRLPRGASRCSVSTVLNIDQPNDVGNSPSTNNDSEGPRVLSVGNELLVLSNRSPNVVTSPGCNDPDPSNCPSSSSNDYLFTSEDGGGSFGPPGLFGTNPIGFGAVVFGTASPFIGSLSSEPGQGLVFQATHAGQFASAGASFGDGLAGGNGNCCLLAVDTATQHPVIAVAQGGRVAVREWSGNGDPDDPSQWSSSASFPGATQPTIAAGPSGVYVAVTPCDSCGQTVVRRVGQGAVGPAVNLGPATNELNLTEDASGAVHALLSPEGGTPQLLLRNSANGSIWSAAQVLAAGAGSTEFDNPRVGVAPDGGGIAVWQSSGGSDANIEVAGFGPTGPTGQPGLGGLAGGSGQLGGGDGGSTSCTTVHMGDIDALSEAGCFLRDPQHPTSGAAVTDGSFRLNGLQVVPDAGVRVVIDPHSHTIDTTGAVSVLLRAPDVGEITLWHGELHVKLGSPSSGQTLFDFDTGQFAAVLKGFPVDGKIDVILEHDAVRIPISLKLPPYLGGITGQATLLANNRDGLVLDSLQISVPDVILGALEIKDLNVSYTRTGDVWEGGAKFNIPPRTGEFAIDVHVRFDHGELTMGSFGLGFFPGIPIFTDLYLNHFGGGFDLRPPKKIFGDVSVGAFPLDPPNYAVNVDGTFSITFGENGSPTIIEIGGTGAIHGEQIANAKVIFQTNGYFEADGNIDVNLGVAEIQGGMQAFADLPAKLFSGDIHGSVTVDDVPVASAEALIGSTGTGACGSVRFFPAPPISGGFFYAWGQSVHFMFGSCDLSPYRVTPVSKAASDARGRAHAAVAGVTIARGTPLADVEVQSAAGAPSVVLTAPDGHEVIPSLSDTAGPAYAVPLAKANRAVIVLNHPAPGTWQLTPAPGSPAITSVASASQVQVPQVRAAIHGRGRHRTLRYRLSRALGDGVQVTFAEQAGRVFHILGTAHGRHGALRFTPADGARGRRAITAQVSIDGHPRTHGRVAAYTAPAPARPGRVRRLSVRLRHRNFVISFAPARDAASYLVRLDTNDGRHQQRLIPARAHQLRLPALGFNDRLAVTVTARAASGRTGQPAHARASATTKKHRATARRHRTH